MEDKNRPGENDLTTGKGQGPQGIDKAAGEEVSQTGTQFTQETQKGKKVDADLEQESDKPIEQQQG